MRAVPIWPSLFQFFDSLVVAVAAVAVVVVVVIAVAAVTAVAVAVVVADDADVVAAAAVAVAVAVADVLRSGANYSMKGSTVAPLQQQIVINWRRLRLH